MEMMTVMTMMIQILGVQIGVAEGEHPNLVQTMMDQAAGPGIDCERRCQKVVVVVATG